MKKQTTSKAMLCPEAYVSVKKSRLPIYNGNTVYLKNSQEFELELFNPTSKTVALYIKINGIQTSNTLLVIRPGMRYFLDRYVDESRKFAFNTYMADDSIEGKTATAMNGFIEVSFYNEKEKTNRNYGPFYNNINYYSTNINENFDGSFTYFTYPGDGIVTTNISNTFFDKTITNDISINTNTLNISENTKSFETGRIEKGNNSTQSFDNYYGDFESIPFSSVSINIKPESQRAETLRTYCMCGKRMKTSWLHCPSCGLKK
jgi:hypothetical protein